MAKGGQGRKEWGIDAFSSGGRRNSQEDNKMILDYLKENLQWRGHYCWRKSRALCWDTSAHAADGWTRTLLAAGGRTWSQFQPPANSSPYNRKHRPFSSSFPPIKTFLLQKTGAS